MADRCDVVVLGPTVNDGESFTPAAVKVNGFNLPKIDKAAVDLGDGKQPARLIVELLVTSLQTEERPFVKAG